MSIEELYNNGVDVDLEKIRQIRQWATKVFGEELLK